jgi:hypothetical protein
VMSDVDSVVERIAEVLRQTPRRDKHERPYVRRVKQSRRK